ncbi:MAG: F0F1 ATP synthase subunit delta [Candidatus Paceibacterota bacterium]
MSIGRKLAEKTSGKNSLKSEMVLDSLKKYNLESILPNFGKSFKKNIQNEEFYKVCRIFSSEKLSDSEINNIKDKYKIPADVETSTHLDENILGGVVVYYQGKKWNDSVRGALNRFNEM